jgi:hypothetical protein
MIPDDERPTMSIPEAAKILGIGVNGAYEAGAERFRLSKSASAFWCFASASDGC